MKELIIFGASGFGREVAWAAERMNKITPTWNLLGFMDDAEIIQGTEYTFLGNPQDPRNHRKIQAWIGLQH